MINAIIDWLGVAVPLFKALHIGALTIWCAGLLTLPLMLARHQPAITQADYAVVRRYTHLTYTLCVTPAAVIAVASGTVLIFLREAFVPWMFAKLVFVALLVALHGWIGHIIVSVAETAGTHRPPPWSIPTLLLLGAMLGILVLVLAKPDFGGIVFPEWLTEPRGGQWPFDVPMR